jgi:tetratricopeptide (TPR) repeat protein
MVSSASGSAAVGSSDDIFAIQDEISAEVVDQLKLELLAGPPSAEQIDPVAYDLYLQGRHLTHTVQTTESYGEAVELLSRAVELAPNYVPAIWELARAITNVSFEDRPAEADKKGRRIRALVDRMVELAPDSSYANGWLGAFAEEQGDLQAAALYRERALAGAVDSNLYLQQALAARFLAKPGRLDEAAALARYVIDRDPACATCVNSLSNVLRQAGLHRESAETLEELREWREFTPCMHWNLGVSWLFAGEPGRSLDHFEKTWPHMRDLGKLFALHDLGRIDEFEAEFSRLRQDPEASPEIIARIYAWTGQNDLAFEYLDYAVEKYGPTVAQSVRTDFYEPIKSDPRWQAFLKRYGVADEDLSHIRFNPKLPAEVVEALARN